MNSDDDESMDSPETSSSTTNSLKGIKIFILQAKINPEVMGALMDDAEGAGIKLVGRPEDAEIIVTEIRMRKRLERHMDWEVAKTKPLVTSAWLTSSAKAGYPFPCGEFAAVKDLAGETIRNCPDSTTCKGCAKCFSNSRSSSMQLTPDALSPPPNPLSPPTFSPATGVTLVSDSLAWDLERAKDKFDNSSRYACTRLCPLVCPNQGLVEELRVMKQARELEGEPRSVLAYSRAIAAIKSFPHRITSERQVTDLPYIGTKIGTMVADYIRTGHIPEAQAFSTSIRFRALKELTSVHGIGPLTARRLYDLGLRNITDLRNYYGVNPDNDSQDIESLTPDDIQDGKESEVGIKAVLRVYDDITTLIPRAEVEEIARCVYAELCVVQKGCAYTITGGYRRGKLMSNDVDIVFTHPTPMVDRGLCKKLVERLRSRRMVSHVMHLSSFRAPSALRKSQWDTLEKALTVFRLPPETKFYDGGKRIHRRVDLIFAPVEVYWCAVIGWTGSTMFERDLRQWTKDKRGWKFDSTGIVKLSNSEPVLATSERHVFELCGLEWIDPTMRNAD
ncbi:Nucleotidyltransferase [Schizopora paradoxa]|uniref:Nucleotidyltransferase n=1 Tax=Schizopora paradoxa TaxID=27342 RepID=A0A0H2S450_9AGAM|nr:Nucleotidyltransferase [Schizopora paradoxa]